MLKGPIPPLLKEPYVIFINFKIEIIKITVLFILVYTHLKLTELDRNIPK